MPIAALLPILVGIAPEIIRWIAGDRAGDVAQQVGSVVSAVAGSDDPSVVQAALADPSKASELRLRLAEIAAAEDEKRRTAELEAMRAVIADTASARAQTVALVQAGSRLAWGPVVVSALVLAGFGLVVVLALFRPIPPGSEALLNILLGNLAAMAMGVVGYWVGSSAGSARKDEMLRGATSRPFGAVREAGR